MRGNLRKNFFLTSSVAFFSVGAGQLYGAINTQAELTAALASYNAGASGSPFIFGSNIPVTVDSSPITRIGVLNWTAPAASSYTLTGNALGRVLLQTATSGVTININSNIILNTGVCSISNGMLKFNASQSWNGISTINIGSAGTIEFNNTGTITSAFSLTGAGNIQVDPGYTLTNSTGIISGVGSLNKTQTGTLILTAPNTYTGGTTISAGTLQVSAGTITGDIVDSAALIFNQTVDQTFAGVISGTGTFQKVGAGTLILTGANTFTGGTTISAGRLQVSAGTITGDIVDFAALTFNQTVDQTFPGVISGTGTFQKVGAGTLILTGANTFSGGTTISAGTLQVSAGNITGDIVDSAALTFNQTSDQTFAGNITGVGTFQKTGAGTLILTGANTFTGGTTISAGTLQVSANTISGNIVDNAVLIFNQSSPGTFTGIISGSGSVTVIGTSELTLSTDNTFSGGLTISAGQVTIANNNNALGTGTLSMQPNAVLEILSEITASNAISLLSGVSSMSVPSGIGTLSGNIAGSGGIDKTGSGTLVLSGDNTYTGDTTVAGGTLIVPGSLTSNVIVGSGAILKGCGSGLGSVSSAGTISPGCSIGTLTINGDFELTCGSDLLIQVSNGSNSDVTVNGSTIIASGCVDLNFDVAPGFTGHRSSFVILSSTGGITGQFSRFFVNNPFFTVGNISCTNSTVGVDFQLNNFTPHINGNNAKNVAAAIIKIANSGNESFDPIIVKLIELPNYNARSSALNEMQPALYKGLAISQENNAVKIQDTLGYRFQQELNEVHCYKPNSSKTGRKGAVACEKDKKTVNVWTAGFGDVLRQSSNTYATSPQIGYQNKTAGVSLGLDGNFADYFYAGALGAYTDSDIKWDNSQGSGDIQTGYGGLYFSAIGDLFYGNLSVIGGWSNYDVKRAISFPGVDLKATNTHGGDVKRAISFPGVDLKATNTHGGSQLLSHVDTGLNLGLGGLTVRPFDSFDYISQSENKFTETGAGVLNLDVRKSNAIMLRNELGIQFAGCLCFNTNRWTVSPKISWVREVRIKGENFTSKFVNTNVPFQSTGYFANRNLLSPGVLVTGLMWEDRLALDLYYNGEFTHGYSDHNYGGQIRFGF